MVLIYDLTNSNYSDFIGELREEARDKEKVSHGRPVLPLELNSLPPYIYVNLLMDGGDKGLVEIRRYDLRLINYKNPLGNVIDVDDFNLYDDESRLVESGFDGLLVGIPTLIGAVNSLVDISDKSEMNVDGMNFNVRNSLAMLCLVLGEGAKLELVSCWLNKIFESKLEVRLTSWLLKRINDWGDLSAELLVADLHDDEDVYCNFYLPFNNGNNGWNDGRRVLGVTCQDIARSLGILRAVPPLPVPMVQELLSGTGLVEIYSVSVYFNGGRSGLIYGTIKIDNAYDSVYIYAREYTNAEHIESHGTLSLQDPDNIIYVRGDLGMELDLMEEGNEVIKGKMLWDTSVRIDRYNTRLSAFVKGKNGYAIVYYTVFNEAIQAVVEATLWPKEDHPNANCAVCVCGKLSAYYRDLVYASDNLKKYYTTPLFVVSKEPSALSCTSEFGKCKLGQLVKPGENIKLSRSCVAVEVSDALIIKADLKSCAGEPVVTGSMEWLPTKLGDFQSVMIGHPNDSHILQVKVKWRKAILEDQ